MITETTTTRSTKGPSFRTSAIVLGIGIVLALPGVLVAGLAFWHALHGPTYEIPGSLRMDLGSGTYLVFERTGSRTSLGALSFQRDRGVTLDYTDLVITGPDGEQVMVDNARRDEYVERDKVHYTSALTFTTPRSGTYTLTFDDTQPGRVMVQRPFEDVFDGKGPWFALIAVGWVTALVGMTMLLTGVIRRGRANRRAQPAVVSQLILPAPAIPPAGWYADPMGQHRLRYWDGQIWTHHFSD